MSNTPNSRNKSPMSELNSSENGTLMLEHVRDLGNRTAEVALKPFEIKEISAVLAILKKFYGEDLAPAAIVPLSNENELRREIGAAAPSIAAVAATLRDRLESSHSCILVERCGLADLEVTQRVAILYAMSLCIGHPTSTSKVDRRVAWDVKVRQAVKASTFSEHAGEADLHTDTQYYPNPERYMLLYCIKPANCGGGISSMRDVDSICEQLQSSQEGRWAMAILLRKELPFKVPAVFTSNGSHDANEVTLAKVLGERPRIRYRTDTLENGLAAHPSYSTPEVRRALDVFRNVLDTAEAKTEHFVQEDGLLIMNNHEALHGRKAFTDPERHFVRIRIAGDASLDQANLSVEA